MNNDIEFKYFFKHNAFNARSIAGRICYNLHSSKSFAYPQQRSSYCSTYLLFQLIDIPFPQSDTSPLFQLHLAIICGFPRCSLLTSSALTSATSAEQSSKT